MAAAIPTPAQMDGRSWLPLVFGGAEQLQAEAGWRHTFMVEYSGGGAPEATEGSEVDAEAGWEASHWCKRHRSHKMNHHKTNHHEPRPFAPASQSC